MMAYKVLFIQLPHCEVQGGMQDRWHVRANISFTGLLTANSF